MNRVLIPLVTVAPEEFPYRLAVCQSSVCIEKIITTTIMCISDDELVSNKTRDCLMERALE